MRPSATTHTQESPLAKVDFGIVTMREDELEAVLRYIPPYRVVTGRRQYNLARIETLKGDFYEVAIVRGLEHSVSGMSEVTRDLLEELTPTCLFAVGIAAALSKPVRIGDVVVSSRIVELLNKKDYPSGSDPRHSLVSGVIAPEIARVIANLSAMKDQLGAWNARPIVKRFSGERPPRVRVADVVSVPLDLGSDSWTLSELREILAPFSYLDKESGCLYRVASSRGSRLLPFAA